MNIPLIGSAIDERFLNHRLRSTSLAGILGGVTAILLFAYHFYIDRIWNWDLFTVAVTILAVKLTAMIWYRLKD